MRKWGFAYIIGISLVIAACGGCGTQQQGKGAVETVNVDDICEEDRALMLRNPLCNGRNLYENIYDADKEHWYWNQLTLDGEIVDHIAVEPMCKVQYATDKEIIYSRITGGYPDNESVFEFWSVPIQQTEAGDKVQWDERKKVSEKKKIHAERIWDAFFYADENFIAFCDDGYDFNVIDRQTGKYLNPKGYSDLTKPGVANNDDEGIYCVAGNNIFLSTKYEGLYRYELGSDTMEQIDAKYHGAYSLVTYPEKNMVLYQRCGVGDECDGESNHGDVTWFVYDYETGEKKVYITDEQWKKAYEDAGVLDKYYQYREEEIEEWNKEYGGTEYEVTEVTFNPTGEFYLYGHKIYSVNDGFVFSIDLEEDIVNPQYEKEFSECLWALDYPWYNPIKFSKRKAHLELKEPMGEVDEDGYPSKWEITEGYFDLVGKNMQRPEHM